MSHRIITEQLEQLARQRTEFDGDYLSRAEALGRLIWKLAEGYYEPDPNNPDRMLYYKPSQWAIQLLLDRLEGKVPHLTPAPVPAPGSFGAERKVSEEVGDLAKQREKANKLAHQLKLADCASSPA